MILVECVVWFVEEVVWYEVVILVYVYVDGCGVVYGIYGDIVFGVFCVD